MTEKTPSDSIALAAQIRREQAEAQRLADSERASAENDEQRDYAEERAQAAQQREEQEAELEESLAAGPADFSCGGFGLSAEQAAEKAGPGSCSCEWADDGNGASGPSPYIRRLSGSCGIAEHREAFAAEQEREKSYLLSALRQRSPQGLDFSADEELALALFRHAEQAIEVSGQGEDDGFDGERAIGRVIAALEALYGISEVQA